MKYTLLLTGLLFLIAHPVSGQEPVFTMEIDATEVLVSAGTAVTEIGVGYSCDQPGIPTSGYQLTFTHDASIMEIVAITSSTPTPSFFSPNYFDTPGLTVVACVFDFGLIETIVTDTYREMFNVGVLSGTGAVAGQTTPITFVQNIPSPPNGLPAVSQVIYRIGALSPAAYLVPDQTTFNLSLRALPVMTRGDVNQSGNTSLVDAIALLEHLFLSTPVNCKAEGDIDAGGDVALVDGILLLTYLFLSGAPPQGGTCTPQDHFGVGCDAEACP